MSDSGRATLDADAEARTPDADPSHGEATQHLAREVGEFVARLRRMVHEVARAVDPSLHPTALRAFSALVRLGPLTVSALASHLDQDKGQVSRAVRDAEALGLIERQPDPSDGRSALLVPTAAGIARFDQARASHTASVDAIVKDWSVADIRELTRLLHALTESGATLLADARDSTDCSRQ